MRTITATPEADRTRIAALLFEAAWVQDLNIGLPEVVADILGSDAAYMHRASDQMVKDELRKTTEEAVAAGAFGAPFFLVGDEAYWGNDRLEMAVSYAASVE